QGPSPCRRVIRVITERWPGRASCSLTETLSTEDGVDVRQPGEPREGAFGRDLLGGGEEAGPRGPRKRAADADPADAERGGLRDRGERRVGEQVDRLRRHRCDDGR